MKKQPEIWHFCRTNEIILLIFVGDYALRIEVEDWDHNYYWAQYDHFKIAAETDNYR